MTKQSKVMRLAHQIVHQLFYAGNYVTTYEDRMAIVEKLVREFMDQQTKAKPSRGGTGARK